MHSVEMAAALRLRRASESSLAKILAHCQKAESIEPSEISPPERFQAIGSKVLKSPTVQEHVLRGVIGGLEYADVIEVEGFGLQIVLKARGVHTVGRLREHELYEVEAAWTADDLPVDDPLMSRTVSSYHAEVGISPHMLGDLNFIEQSIALADKARQNLPVGVAVA